MQPIIYYLGSIILLIAMIVALICIIVLRDRREIKAKQVAADLSQIEELVRDMKKIRDDLVPAATALKKNEATLSHIEGQLKQIGSTVAGIEHRPQPVSTGRDRQDDRRDRDRGHRQSGKGKGWGGGRSDGRSREYSGAAGERDESVTINDGEKYAKVSELAAHGLTAQEIAKKLNVGPDEVSLVLELKRKKQT
jgi:hypothetical protein